jgi:hypothetical protein
MFNFQDYFEDENESDSSVSPEKTVKRISTRRPILEENLGCDFNAELLKKEKEKKIERERTLEEKRKYEETQRHIQEQSIKKIYNKVGKKRRAKKTKEPKIKNVKRMNKQNLKQKYTDKLHGKVNSFKTRYYANGFSKKLYMEKYKKEQDKLDMEAMVDINLEELSKQNDIGKEGELI